MIIQCCSKKLFGVIRQQTINWTNVHQVPRCYMLSLGPGDFKKNMSLMDKVKWSEFLHTNYPFACPALYHAHLKLLTKPANTCLQANVYHANDLSMIMKTPATGAQITKRSKNDLVALMIMFKCSYQMSIISCSYVYCSFFQVLFILCKW